MMQGKRLMTILATGALALALAVGAWAQGPPPPPSKTIPAPKMRQPLQRMTVKGKIKPLKGGGYYIRSKPEVYRIFNPNPQVLAGLAKSGKTLVIVAKPHGDILEIISIDGKPYPGSEKPKSK
jgi:hypothetical protein